MSVTPTNGNLVAAVPDPFAYKTLEHSTFAPPPEPRRCPPPRPSRRAQVKVTYFRSINQKPSIRRPLRIGYQIVLANFQVVAPETGSMQQIRFTGADQPAFARRISRLYCTSILGRCTLASPSVGALDSCPFHPLTQQGHKYILADPPSLRAGDQCKSGLAKHRYPAIKCVVFGAPLRTSEPNPSDALKNMCACRIKA